MLRGPNVALKFVIPFIWVGGWIVASIIYRRSHGKAVIPRAPVDVTFREDWCSGRSLRNWLTRIGGARNCLMVYIDDRELVVTPEFPFSLMFLPEIYGLDVRVPLTMVVSAEPTQQLLGRAVRVTFASGGPAPLELKLRDEAAFIARLAAGPQKRADRPEAVVAPRRGYRLIAFRVFMAVWGFGALAGAFSGLPDDYRFRRDGVETAGVFDGHSGVTGDRNDRGVLSYSVAGQRYHLTSLQGSGIYKIGGTASVFYLPGKPDQAREAGFFPFDLLWLGLGMVAIALAIFSGRIVRKLRQ